ncbi:MAG: hypothetical protein F6K44_01600 [Moorea sp. SIO3E2]|uniref:hypothetical protein n=1 Tax=Moorena sp. SIO4E2 TaxID=2607826 RepID=UPI0013B75DCD|nr:hypothetical protein [Moorena sp. SIO4E2]NEQ07983.1 hypothetical protein [Moorena sp. SIO4E2]NEQ12632.1 hypothetical protein [Moorena sp. SIO3E2]
MIKWYYFDYLPTLRLGTDNLPTLRHIQNLPTLLYSSAYADKVGWANGHDSR